MANQTITTGTPASPINYDDASISGLLNGETITINGGALKIDSDVRWNQQAAVFGSITLSSTLGGSFVIDGSQVWEVPFSASTGNVPTQNALGLNGVTGGTSGATGELTRVWATGSLDPATAGGAMPATGWIKLRSKTGTFQNGETITLPNGATVTASGAGKRSWIHVVGRAGTSSTGARLTVPRLATFNVTGDWYELGTTNGSDNQTLQFPVADQCPALWIETAPNSNVYEIWLNAFDRWSGASGGAVATSDKRGMFFGVVQSTGIITIALRGSENAGLKPPSGCRIRIPNVILSNADGQTPSYDTNILPSGVTARYSFTTTSAGSVVMRYATCNWYVATSAAYLVNIRDSSIGSGVSFANTGNTVTLNNVGIIDTTNNIPVSIQTSYGGGLLTDVRAMRRLTTPSSGVAVLVDTADFVITRCRNDAFGAVSTNNPNNTGAGFLLTRSINTEITDSSSIGSIGVFANPAFGLRVNNFAYAIRSIGTTQTSDTISIVNSSSGSTDIFVSNLSNFDNIANVHPYASLVSLSTGVNNAEIRNIGTNINPFDMGTLNACATAVNAASSKNVIVRRVYVQNTRTAPVLTDNTVQGFDCYNVWGDVADTLAISAINGTIRGGRFTNATVGQTAVYGSHWLDTWTSTTTGRIVIACNEPTSLTTGQCSFTLDSANGSGFTSTGSVAMTKLSDEIIWTMPYYALGITGFQNVAPTITGTNVSNHILQFQWDTGSGWNGTWLALTGANLSAITVTPSVGIRFRVRATVNTASLSNLLTYIRIDTNTTSLSQQIEYPFPGSLLTILNLAPNSRVKVTRVDTGELLIQDSTIGTSLTLDIAYNGAVRVEARNASGATTYRPWLTQVTIATGVTTTITALQEVD